MGIHDRKIFCPTCGKEIPAVGQQRCFATIYECTKCDKIYYEVVKSAMNSRVWITLLYGFSPIPQDLKLSDNLFTKLAGN